MAFRGALDFKTTHGGPPVEMGPFTVGAAALEATMPVKLTAGLLVIAATNDTNILGWCVGNYDASATNAYVYLAEPGLWVKLVYDGTLAEADIPLSVEITVSATTCIANADEYTNEVLNCMSVVDSTAKTAWFAHKYASSKSITAND